MAPRDERSDFKLQSQINIRRRWFGKDSNNAYPTTCGFSKNLVDFLI